MAAMVQPYPQQSGTITMLQTRPSSSSAIMPGHAQSNSHSHAHVNQQQYMTNGRSHRNSFHGLPGVPMDYRGSQSAPIQPYAFTATPNLAGSGQWQQPYGAYRTTSSPNAPTMQAVDHNMAARPRLHNYASAPQVPRPQSTLYTGSAGQPTFAQVAAAKASPERYRRPVIRQVDLSSAQQGSSSLMVQPHAGRRTDEKKQSVHRGPNVAVNRPHSANASADDTVLHRHPTDEQLKSLRRRSMHSFDATEYPKLMTPQELLQQQTLPGSNKSTASNLASESKAAALSTAKKTNVNHTRTGSTESQKSSHSSNSRPTSSANRNNTPPAPTASPAPASNLEEQQNTSKPDYPNLVNIPPRGSSSDVGKRVLNPSPLSKPANMASGSAPGADSSQPSGSTVPASAPSPTKPPGSSHGSIAESPAAKHLAAINEKSGKAKSKTSRLRRAFSFGSAAEFRKAEADEKKPSAQNEPSKLHKDPRPEELYEEEQAKIAKSQEASGLGNSIYSGTKIFAGSTDNLSISSTASSASIMLRKMGRGVKKGGRSLVGLFRPKSVIGSPLADATGPEASQAEVSMITVEAERERVNVNSNSDLEQPNGETGYPRLERNSLEKLDTSRLDSLQSDRTGSSGGDSGVRKSIVGGDSERAEVLATIRKGILKTRSNSPSPVQKDAKVPAFELPSIPNVSDSPLSSAPSTPTEDAQGHKHTGSVTIGNEDYFMSALRLRHDSKSAPGTPQGGISKRNATFSPRIVFYDTWPSGEYDRRGEISTCNRLTPMLAQQIKEELNSFKMEMEVHETSKIYTHFF